MKTTLFWLATIVIGILLVATCAISCVPAYWDSSPNWPFFGWFPFVWFPFGLFGLGLYFLPIIVAAVRRKKNMLGIVLLNVLAGWTLIGWIIALVWSFSPDK